ncbi:hypothetical protein [Phenylobacterium sp.]|uniref:hypothetical protein n=1 Tax=Phenylobacterium sp. TaxID=1871053 RepID=UPI002DF44DC6|nr:hypothetical protein [Phenylobacterium sp.]
MHRILRAGLAGVGLAMISGFAAYGAAASAADADGWLYFVNVAAHPLTLVVDGAHMDLPVRTRIAQPLSPGSHGLAAVLGARTASQYSAFDLDAAAHDRGRAYWCFLGAETRGEPHLIAVAPEECTQLIRAGRDDEAPSPTKPRLGAATASNGANAR